MDKLKIIVACHRPFDALFDNLYVPIHAGKTDALDPRFPIDEAELEEFLKSGLDASQTKELAGRFHGLNELSRVFYAWKNYQLLGNPDFIGMVHYRRQFIFNESLKLPDARWLPKAPVFVFPTIVQASSYIKSKDAINILNQGYDLLCTKKYDCRDLGDGENYQSCKDRYLAIGCNPDLYDLMEKLLLEYDSSYKTEVEELRRDTKHYLFNMFVMKKDLFNKYCEMMFTILFKLDDANKDANSFTVKRSPGFLAEFLTSMFISHEIRVSGIKHKELNTTFIETTSNTLSMITWKDMLSYANRLFKVKLLGKKKNLDDLARRKSYLEATLELYTAEEMGAVKKKIAQMLSKL